VCSLTKSKKMKTILKSIILSLAFLPFSSLAQNGMQDVIYLKDGNIYKGAIIETVPNESYKIQSEGGNVYAVTIAEVEKITKEELKYYQRGFGFGRYRNMRGWRNDSIRYQPRERGYFNEVQVLIENVQGGVRIVNGYKFNRFAYLGIGIGFDRVFSNPFNPRINGLDKKELAGTYLPLYLYYSGDGSTRGRFTPFYAVEAGYAMVFNGFGDEARNVDDFGNRLQGGIIAGAGIGFKVRSARRRGHFSVLFNVNYKQVNYEYDQLFLDQGGQITGSVEKEGVAHLIIPGIRIGIGF
jgi:hypothetical protein